MAGTLLGNWQQYFRWTWIIAKSCSLNPPTAPERTAITDTIHFFCNTATGGGTRPWLTQVFQEKSVQPNLTPGAHPGDPDIEPDWYDAKLLKVISRDIKKIPLTDGEKTQIDTLITATGNRRYGTQGGNI